MTTSLNFLKYLAGDIKSLNKRAKDAIDAPLQEESKREAEILEEVAKRSVHKDGTRYINSVGKNCEVLHVIGYWGSKEKSLIFYKVRVWDYYKSDTIKPENNYADIPVPECNIPELPADWQ